MQKNSNSRSAPPPSKSSSLLAGILLGMVVGLLIAGGLAWYILKTPSSFVDKVPHESVKLAPDVVKPAPVVKAAPEQVSAVTAASGVAAASAVDDGKPRFEFYKVLTDKQDATAPAAAGAKPADKASGKEIYFLQAGAFNNPADADKLKAKLAMLGIEANVQTATLPDKVVWHRVRLGPYKSADEMNKAAALLKQNGVNTTPTHPQ